ncbi:protein of unknown function [Brochothrix thermosphacta]|nr:hypothetical protein BTH160X_100129 [Brochothrix thermosphacta]SPN72762.1 protein of unknown function [Brochothrix thermosphacta]
MLDFSHFSRKKDSLQDLAPFHRNERLPGVIGPVPQPLVIRVVYEFVNVIDTDITLVIFRSQQEFRIF